MLQYNGYWLPCHHICIQGIFMSSLRYCKRGLNSPHPRQPKEKKTTPQISNQITKKPSCKSFFQKTKATYITKRITRQREDETLAGMKRKTPANPNRKTRQNEKEKEKKKASSVRRRSQLRMDRKNHRKLFGKEKNLWVSISTALLARRTA